MPRKVAKSNGHSNGKKPVVKDKPAAVPPPADTFDPNNFQIVGDGRGTMQGDYLLNTDRPIDRVRWALECFPEWGRWLNREIEETQVPEGNYAIWWLGAMGFVFKSPGGAVLLVDNYAGPAHYTEYEYCGVCRTSGSPTIDWMRLNPQIIDIFGFKTLDAVFCSHQHADHTDIYTLKATSQTTDAFFVGPLSSVERMRKFGVPEERIRCVRPGDSIKIKDVTIDMLPNYDRIASMTGTAGPGRRRPYADVAISFFFQVKGGNFLHLADTLYNNAYKTFGEKYDIDVISFNIGRNAPGATDKMTPIDAVRVGEAMHAKVLFPMHWDNWGNTQADPEEVRYFAEKYETGAHVVIPQWGIKWLYPLEGHIKRMHYSDWRERYRSDYSWIYGKPAEEAAKELGLIDPVLE